MTAATLGLTSLVGCSKTQESIKTETALSIKAIVVQPTDRELIGTYTGSLEGEQQAMLIAKISEAVDSVLVHEGNRVKAGDVIVTLDKTGPSTGYQQALSTFQNAEKNYKKMQYLFKEGAVSESEHDAAETSYEVAQAAFEAVNRLVRVETPIAGIATSIDVTAGDFVNLGQKLATIATTDRLRIKFGVNAEEVAQFTVGGTVRVVSEAVAHEATGKVARVASSADPVTRTFQVEALIENAEGKFRPGMFVRVQSRRQSFTSVLTVPSKAVLTLEGEKLVYTVENGRAHQRPVEIGADLFGELIVTSGLQPGDTVVTLGQDYLNDNTLVTITDLSEPQS
jgi:membrane fusion protein (multidrug efflux system)